MAEFWGWITDLGNSKMVALILFFSTFVGILIYLYSSRGRSERLESYKYMPFDDDADEQHSQDKKDRL
ncbi:Cbb3-type cytochrome oxidase component FixQ [Ectothiorhodosinus mongolicus]|uniref:Cbb3-type cytochrome oxidase component FixQ n=1 Tax=Ectothiorhodosinus mongolicus TaxID=233100 RepID=A0A1R3VUQ4_9GAMM|nr:cbb3-type cytochrome c oxidase subunit 3 [Ectothiorhodosinus mongolicus]ULX56856.1 cbb3-type cytochrome c oxidase subunit 3 [Ectothiorhodosinus mongolicus]SIT68672.1 Cbb3-type cytochrome oxidase component FixQ [Ectothiorhodosinus mongolicus]